MKNRHGHFSDDFCMNDELFHHENFLKRCQRSMKKTKSVDNYIKIHYTNFQNSHTIIFRNLNWKILNYDIKYQIHALIK